MPILISMRPRAKQLCSFFCSKHGKRSWIAVFILLHWLASGLGSALAQTADEHSAHHPSPPSAATSASPPTAKAGTAPASAGTAPGCMGMGCTGAPAKAFYPWLMDLPQLTPEARQFIEDEAKRRTKFAHHFSLIPDDTLLTIVDMHS